MTHGPEMTMDGLLEYIKHLEELCKAEHQRALDAQNYRSEQDKLLTKHFEDYHKFMDDLLDWGIHEPGDGTRYRYVASEASLIGLLDYKYKGLSSFVSLLFSYIHSHRSIDGMGFFDDADGRGFNDD